MKRPDMTEMMAHRKLRRNLGEDLASKLSQGDISVRELATRVAGDLHMKTGSAEGYIYRMLKARTNPEYPSDREKYARYFGHFTTGELDNYKVILKAAGFSNSSPIVKKLEESFRQDFKYS